MLRYFLTKTFGICRRLDSVCNLTLWFVRILRNIRNKYAMQVWEGGQYIYCKSPLDSPLPDSCTNHSRQRSSLLSSQISRTTCMLQHFEPVHSIWCPNLTQKQFAIMQPNKQTNHNFSHLRLRSRFLFQ